MDVPWLSLRLCPYFSCAPSQLLASSFAPLLLLCPCACRSCLPCSWCPRSLATVQNCTLATLLSYVPTVPIAVVPVSLLLCSTLYPRNSTVLSLCPYCPNGCCPSSPTTVQYTVQYPLTLLYCLYVPTVPMAAVSELLLLSLSTVAVSVYHLPPFALVTLCPCCPCLAALSLLCHSVCLCCPCISITTVATVSLSHLLS
jgi:hypothetical protein